jgi:hypothetical protein
MSTAHGDARRPAAEVRRFAERVDTHVGIRKRLLQEIVHVLFAPQQPMEHPRYVADVPPVQRSERLIITLPNALDEHLVQRRSSALAVRNLLISRSRTAGSAQRTFLGTLTISDGSP